MITFLKTDKVARKYPFVSDFKVEPAEWSQAVNGVNFHYVSKRTIVAHVSNPDEERNFTSCVLGIYIAFDKQGRVVSRKVMQICSGL